MDRTLRSSVILLWLSVLLAACSSSAPPPSPTPTHDPFDPPIVNDPPTQADLGERVYWQVCMACHGDQGQGLTDAWRELWQDENGDDSNCWEAECHGNNHPPHGFSFPRFVPPVFGEGTLARFSNALELYHYLKDTMPWWKPGYLEDEQYWQLTAFFLRERGVLPDGVTLEAGNAAAFPLRLAAPPPANPRPAALLLSTLLALAAGVITLQRRLER